MICLKKILTLFVLTVSPVIAFATSCENSNFKDNGNGTVSDTKTGLMWKKCSESQRGSDCESGGAGNYTWQNALQQAKSVNDSGGFAGYKDWRVPNIKELESITDKRCYEPAINLTIFPNTRGDYWSSSTDRNDSYMVSYINFNDGYPNYLTIDSNAHVRLVRGR